MDIIDDMNGCAASATAASMVKMSTKKNTCG